MVSEKDIRDQINEAIRQKLGEITKDVKVGKVCTPGRWINLELITDIKARYQNKHNDIVDEALANALDDLCDDGFQVEHRAHGIVVCV
jgi:bacterioferritin-associated ferredoxin